ncbi:signal peptidase II [Candidatus Woesearchaeota archaeon]|jgi:signal peptidase II|nr:signal peptidase II [Candidatus Woesearchaeota archaeon]MBT6044787.1 signal peptidase II [Candidatus Woesearchaeota archaeon]
MIHITKKKQGYILALIILLVDQLLKLSFISNNNYITNTGAAWGLLQGSNFLLIIFSFVVIFYINRYFLSHPLALSILLGGVLGNLFDRIFRGHVIDFIDIKLFNYPLFNIADIAIVLAIFLIILKKK